MDSRRNIPLNEIGAIIHQGKVEQPRFVTDNTQTPADQKAGEHDRQTIRLLPQNS